jgi:pilus assembly protein Flp/PilA
MIRIFRLALLRSRSGATAIEYALIAALVSIAMIVALILMGSSIDDMLTYVANVLSDAANQASGS